MSSRAVGIVSPSLRYLRGRAGIGSLPPGMDDLAIRGGLVVDGTGAPGREADAFVREERIVAIEREGGRPARRTIDARGHVVAPGFIDIHTHSDFTLPLNPRAEGKIRQGVTTEVVGNCGFSVAPALPGTSALLGDYLGASAPGLPFQDATFAERPTMASRPCGRRSPSRRRRGSTCRSRTSSCPAPTTGGGRGHS